MARRELNRVAVTGGAGFIGSHLAEELEGRGFDVTILDDLSTGKMSNIEGLVARGNVRFVRGSVTDLPLLSELFQNTRYIFHLAATTSITRSLEDPLSSLETNIGGTLNVLLAARDNRAEKVVFASSAAVYGDTPSSPQQEGGLPNPMSPYAVTKLAGENYCESFRRAFGLPAVSLRYFNVYGPKQDPDSQYAAVVPAFIKRALEGKPLIIYGDGDQTRDFVFVKDVVEANIQAAQSDASGVFNISRGESITINRLAEVVAGLCDLKVNPLYRTQRPGEIRHSLADISKAKAAFGFEPEYDLSAGLAETIKWFRKVSPST